MSTVGIRCDAGPGTGVGHLVRCLALAEELTARGTAVHVLGDLGGLPWAAAQVHGRGLPLHPPPPGPDALVAAARRLHLDALVVDSYTLPPGHTAAVRAAGIPVLAVVDGDLRGQQADVYVDQNLGAEHAAPPLPPGAVRLAGLDHALLRTAVRSRRPAAPPAARPGVPRVVAFFGGTDAYRAAPTAARLLAATGAPYDAVVVGATDGLRRELAAVAPGAGRLEVVAPTDDLPALLAAADLAVSASGTSTWELLCLGLPAALVWVVDNQLLGYGRTVERGLAAGLGRLGDLTGGGEPARRAVATLGALLREPDRRAALAARAWAAVDGGGVRRVADALLTAAHGAPGGPAGSAVGGAPGGAVGGAVGGPVGGPVGGRGDGPGSGR